MAEFYFPDTTVMCNFGVVGQLGMLKGYLRGRGRIVQAIEREIEASSAHVPALTTLSLAEWFGIPIRITRREHIAAVDRTRVNVFGGTAREPKKHLGESQTLFLLSNDSSYTGSIWITDDLEAYDVAAKRGLIVRSTVDVFRALIAEGEITADSALELCRAIDAHPDRFVRAMRQADEIRRIGLRDHGGPQRPGDRVLGRHPSQVPHVHPSIEARP